MEENNANKKTEFVAPTVEVRRFSVRDVVRTSPIIMPFDPNYEDDEDI
ncbi:MAG: hypothetical protein IJR90_05225 [Clostridia bacterium]|nr:hypothetical protein [Clostridia bacterium]MBQ9879501.1 hypothetical protein [Clostridia bacterium]